MFEASGNYATHPLVIADIDHYKKEAVSQVQLRSVPSTTLTMEAGCRRNTIGSLPKGMPTVVDESVEA